jgi:hypothetical protein
MPGMGFEHTTSVSERDKTFRTLDLAGTGIGFLNIFINLKV